MANNWSRRPIEIDTSENKAGQYIIDFFEWHPNAQNNTLVVKDAAGSTLFKRKADAGGAPNGEASYVIESKHLSREVNGLYITISAGILYIHQR